MKLTAAMCLGLILLTAPIALGDEGEKKTEAITFADGKLEMSMPEGWKKVRPNVGIIEYEFAIDPAEGDKDPGRATMMGAGGSIDANIDRWRAQFSKLESDQVEKEKISEQDVHIVELQGTYRDQRGPFAPATVKENYTVLAAIISTKNSGNYFLKFYGPKKTIGENKEKFLKMVNSLKTK